MLRAIILAGAIALLGAASAQAAPTTGMLLTQGEIDSLPAVPSAIRADADAGGTPNLANQDSTADTNTLAAALVFAKTGESSYGQRVCSALDAVQGTESGSGSRGLSVGRGLLSYVVAADLVNAPATCAHEAAFRSWLSSVRTERLPDGRTVVSTHEDRPNNWGTHAGASRIAADIYLGDQVDLARAAKVFEGWAGNRAAYSSFSYGDLSWQCHGTAPVGINEKGCVKNGVNIDGVLPDDQRRSGFACCTLSKENYVYEALQGALMQAYLLQRQGYSSLDYSDQAVKRAYVWLHAVDNFQATGDDEWQIPLVNRLYGTAFPTGTGTSVGKGMGYAGWWAKGISSAPSTDPPPDPDPTPEPTCTCTQAEYDAVVAERNSLKAERDNLAAENSALKATLDRVKSALSDLVGSL